MTSLYTRFVESGYALLSRTTPLKAWQYFDELQKNQWLPLEGVQAIQWQKLRKLLTYCMEHVPFYRRIWTEAGVDPRQFTGVGDLSGLPTVDKPALIRGQENNEFLLDGKPGLEKVHTSGTTGPYFYVPFTLADFQKKYANHLRQMYASGWRLGEKSASLYYSGHPQFHGKYTGRPEVDSFVQFRKLALSFAHRRLSLTPYHEKLSGNDAFCADWYPRLKRYRPMLLETMEFNLPVLMDYIERLNLPPLEIPIIFLLGTLSQRQREKYMSFFHAEVFDRYSPHEMEGIAFSCKVHRGMHIAIDSFCVEFVDDRNDPVGPEGLGQITVTDLDNYTMPLVRYRVGDVGFYYKEPCTCGRGLPLMGEIAGRTRDVVSVDSIAVPPSRLNAVLQDCDNVVLFQIVQSAAKQITVDIVPREKANREELAQRVRAGLNRELQGAADVSVKFVSGIELEANGKICLTKRAAGLNS